MIDAGQPSAQEGRAQELQRAFDAFNQVSQVLTMAYQGLQDRVESLTAELATANGELRRQHDAKEALAERLRLLLNALPAGVIVLDGEACVGEANPAARRILGQAIVGESWPALVRSRLVATETPAEWQAGGCRVAIVESAIDSAGGRIILVHDVTAAHSLKTELERNQRLAAMGEMAASLAHQLRTPLATALLYSANLCQSELGDAARIRFAEKTTAQLRRLERLIQEVLLFARGEHAGSDRMLVAQLLADAAQTVQPLFREKNVAYRVDCGVGQQQLSGSRKALSGALVNLLENALQACTAGGEVTLTARAGGGQLRIGVRDTGQGIPPEVQARVFEPFFTTRAQGTGLGLAIALGVARAHGGSIRLSSAPAQGSEFVLVLPIESTDQQEG
ncbi:MAG TPA: ATP-binding protein [Candidatus Accumulibacter phosphatis]|nr:MAG: Sensor protein ZraS [Candidatus Accumulibacter sp. SK-11]HAY29004.1 PAS domain-containing protein [Accumulibacter sp.]HCN69839.1 PAS domain-containing protein [Accumulibacter sp.]HRL77885.1 ATP-binding protein [Candidatus Accumulibacter phosphatis]HRQ96176.1 ATP-binding protein [Candidatus Accumulibacter phosphatis]